MRQRVQGLAAGGDELQAALDSVLTEQCRGNAWPVTTQVIGPLVWRDGTRFLPAPKCLVMQEDRALASLRPVDREAVPGWHPDDGLVPLATGSDVPFEPLPETYLPWSAVCSYLNDGVLPSAQMVRDGLREHFIADEMRVGVGISKETGTAQESLLYTSTFMRLRQGCAFDVELRFQGSELPEDFLRRIEERKWLRLGGEGMVARIEQLVEPEEHPWTVPGSDRPLVYLATPGRFDNGSWKPAQFDGSLVAAAVGSPVAFSRWDLAANKPMKSLYAVPAGAVYFCDSVPDPIHRTCIADCEHEKASGWGYCLQGAWS